MKLLTSLILSSSVCVLMLSAPAVSALSYTLEITESELQEKVSAIMPIEKKRYFTKIILSNPKVDLIGETNEIGVLIDIVVKGPGGISGQGNANIKGGITYDKKKGAFYLKNPSIVSLNVGKVNGKIKKQIKKLLQYALKKALAKRPVYQFKDDKLKHRLAKSVLESVTIKNEKLLVRLSLF